MSNVLEAFFILIVFGILLALGLGSNAIISGASLGGCAKNDTGSWENCSLSDSQAEALSTGQDVTGKQFAFLSASEWLVFLAVFIAAVFMLASVGRERR